MLAPARVSVARPPWALNL